MAIGAGALLVRSNLITSAQLEEARSHQAQHGGTIGEYLVLYGLVDDEVLTGFYHSRLMVPRNNPNQLARLPRRTIAKVPGDMATEFRLVPVGLDAEQNLTVVMSDPSDTHAVDELGFFTGCYVMRAVATQRQIAWCLAHYYGFVSALGETLLEDSTGAAPQSTGAGSLGAGADGATDTTNTTGAMAGKLSPANGVPRPVRGPGPVTKQVRASQHRVIPPVSDSADMKPREHSGPTSPINMGGAAVKRSPTKESGPTRPIRQVRRRPNQEPNPPELAARAGEISAPDPNDDMPTTGIQALPAVVIVAADASSSLSGPRSSNSSNEANDFGGSVAVEDDPIATITEVEETDTGPAVEDAPGADASGSTDEDSDEVVLLDRPTRSSSPPALDLVESSPAVPDDPVVVLDRPKRRSRSHRITDVGVGVAAADREDDAEPVDIELPSVLTGPTTRDAVPVAIEAAARQADADATSRYQRVAAAPGSDNKEDDEFGPPGTTIPPPYLGAMPDSDLSGPQNAIPLNLPEDPSAAATLATPSADPMVTLADAMSEVAHNQRELDLSSARLLPTLRALDAAPTRDAIVEALLDFMTRSFNRATFFVVRAENLTPFRSKLGAETVGRLAPGWKSAKLRLSVPSTFRDVLQNRLPFRGHLPDRASLAFAERIFGTSPSETLLVPCTVRDRPVGVLCGCDRSARIFHEHLSLVTRGASDAFERIIKTRRG